MTEKVYMSRNMANMQTRLTMPDKSDYNIQFVHKQFKTDDEAVIAAFDLAISKSATLRREIVVLDKAAAEAHLKATLANKRSVAASGGFHTGFAEQMRKETPEVNANDFVSKGVAPADAAQVAGEVAAGASAVVDLLKVDSTKKLVLAPSK